MNTKDLIEELQKMPLEATIFLTDDNIEILGAQYERGVVQIITDDRCVNCDNLEREIDSKNEYIEELQEEQIGLRDQVARLANKLMQISKIID